MKINVNKTLWLLFNLLIFAGWCVFSGFYVAGNYPPDTNVWLAILILAAIFVAVRIVVNILCQIGQAALIKFLGLKVNYFEAAFFIWRFDGERGRVKIGGGLSTLWSGTVYPRIKGSLDSAAGYAKNAAKYGKVFLGAPSAGALILFAVIVYMATKLILKLPLEPISLAVAVAAWYALYNALTEDYKRRGGFLTYLKYKSDGEARLLGIASQGLVEMPDRFILDEAQKLIQYRIGVGLEVWNRQTFNILSYIALTDALNEYALAPELKDFIYAELLTYESLIGKDPQVYHMAVGRSRMFICARLVAGEVETARSALNVYARLAKEIGLRDTSYNIYFADMNQILNEKDADTLSSTDLLFRDPYGRLFKGYREFIERADDAAHQTLFRFLDEHQISEN
ncbi:hypothetical protein FACS1894211_10110 [Clostridia bacterium]|nr:hypothetical protein FACS1894211_10110 [Clostridia bacterium]